MDKKWEQLIAAKTLPTQLASLHEATALQIRNYPYLIPNIALKPVPKTSIDYERRLVEYECHGDKKFKFTKLSRQCCEKIVEVLRMIIWDDTDMTLTVDGEKVYDSREQSKN